MLPVASARPELSQLDRYLAVWVMLAIAFGVELSAIGAPVPAYVVPAGLIAMMYPALLGIEYKALPGVVHDRRLLGLAVVQSTVVAPLLVFGIAELLVRDRPDYVAGLVMTAVAPGIALAVWSELAHADRAYTAGLVALNALAAVFGYAAGAWILMRLLPPLLGLPSLTEYLGAWDVARGVVLYLVLPLAAAALTRASLGPRLGERRFERRFVLAVAPLSAAGLLVTVVAMFSRQGARLISHPLDAVVVAGPLAASLVVMFVLAFVAGRRSGAGYARTTSLALSAASSNFRLAIAVSIGVFGIASGQAFAAVVDSLVEVPVLLALVNLAPRLRGTFTRDPVVVAESYVRARFE